MYDESKTHERTLRGDSNKFLIVMSLHHGSNPSALLFSFDNGWIDMEIRWGFMMYIIYTWMT